MPRHFALVALALTLPGTASLSWAAPASAPAIRTARAALTLPLRFEAQPDPNTPFVARTNSLSVLLGSQYAMIHVRNTQPIRIDLEGANPASLAEGLDEFAARSNYFIGRDPAGWRLGVHNYQKVRYRDVWPGIDLVYYGNGDRLEYDFVLAPGADPRSIAFHVRGSRDVRLDPNGDLLLGEGVRQHKPRVYQKTAAGQRSIAGRYVLVAGNGVRFELGKYDRRLPLIIDPVLSYSTLFGGLLDDSLCGVAVDSAGNAYITGATISPDLPATAGGTKYQGSVLPDIYVAKIKPDGSGVVYCAYIGGNNDDEPDAIAIDSSGNAYVTGYTFSTDFPTTTGAVQSTYAGGKGDAFVFKLGPAGNALTYSTYLGGASEDEGRAIAVDSTGNAYVAGITSSSAFPLAGSSYQSKYRGGPYDGFVSKLNPTGTALVYSTLLGSSGDDELMGIAVDSGGSAYVTGTTDAQDFPTTKGVFMPNPPNPYVMSFVTKVNPAGSALVYSTYLGGNVADFAMGIAVDSAGSAYVVGGTGSNTFPKTPGVYRGTFAGGALDAFVTELKPDASGLVYSTFLGGTDNESANAVAVDSAGNAYVTGTTSSTDFPTGGSPFQSALGGAMDAFVTKLNPTGAKLIYSSYLGGSQNDHGIGIGLDSSGCVYAAGTTLSSNFRTTTGTRKAPSLEDAFIVKVQEVALPSLAVDKNPLAFSFDVTGAAPGPQTLQLTSTGASLAFTATTAGAAWLAVGPGSGATPATLSAFVNPTGLSPNTYNGNIVITSSGAANSPLTIPVKLVVTQAQPAPTLSAILPNSVAAGSPDTTLTVTGTNFVSTSAVQVNGTAVATTFVNSTTLTAVVPAANLAQAGTLSITVSNPAPNAVITAALTLTVTSPLPAVQAAGIVNDASAAGGAIAPGEMLKINGSNFGPVNPVQADGSSGAYDTTLAGVRVWFDSYAAPLLSVSATQILLVVPFELDGQQNTQFQVEYNGQRSAPVPLAIAPAAPALFTVDGSGQGQGQILNADATPNSKDNPAAPGSVVALSATGGGQTTPASVDGAVATDNTPLLNQPIGVQIGGLDCDGVTAGPTPGMISGMLQVTATIPAGLSGTVPVVFTVGGVPSQAGVTLEVTPAAQ